ncbi:hypothetical protein [Methylosinus sporium]|uniref:hypothetical protein n=1 Tax=Methylosinus sporium TaxID=428 RepID=UPI00383B258B
MTGLFRPANEQSRDHAATRIGMIWKIRLDRNPSFSTNSFQVQRLSKGKNKLCSLWRKSYASVVEMRNIFLCVVVSLEGDVGAFLRALIYAFGYFEEWSCHRSDAERGAIGRVDVAGRSGASVILKRYGSSTRVITHRTADLACADCEYITPREPIPLFIPMRLYLAYGVWTEGDGAKVLFSRDYFPLWRIREDAKPERLKPWQWIHYVDQRYFWEGSRAPWVDPAFFQCELDRLKSFGVCGLPLLVEALPIVVSRDDAHSFSDAVSILAKTYQASTAAA